MASPNSKYGGVSSPKAISPTPKAISPKYGGPSSPTSKYVGFSPKASSPKSGMSSGGMEVHKPQCVCAPTTHEGSFRCRLHRSSSSKKWDKLPSSGTTTPVSTISPTIEAQ